MRRLIFGLLICFTTVSPVVPESHLASVSQQKIVTAAQVNGTWRYKGNTLKVWSLGQQKLKVEFFGIYSYRTPDGWMANSGSGIGIAQIEGDTAFFRPADVDEECQITMRFTKGKLVVEQEGICGFGFNVTAAGTYRRVNRAKPKFEEN
jgi:hypothetical protein